MDRPTRERPAVNPRAQVELVSPVPSGEGNRRGAAAASLAALAAIGAAPASGFAGRRIGLVDNSKTNARELLTDIQLPEIEKMKRESHPMQAKKDLAQRIVADFHSPEAAQKAAEDWAKLRQREMSSETIPDDIEEVQIPFDKIRASDSPAPGSDSLISLRLDRLLVLCGLADSTTDAGRKLKASSVELLRQDGVRGEVYTAPHLAITNYSFPMRLVLRVGRKVKAAIIDG